LAAQPAAASAAQGLSEREALERFFANDPRLRALDARVEEVRALHAERAVFPNPSLTYSRESVFDTDETFLVARQEAPISGRRGQLQTAGSLATRAAEADARFTKVQLQADLRSAYTALVLAQAREEVIGQAIDALGHLVSVLRTREREGEGSAYDRMRGERALIELEADLTVAAASRAEAQGRLAGFFGPRVAPETLRAAEGLDSGSTPAAVSAMVEEALSNRGDYRAAELSVQQFASEREAASRLAVPTPTFTAGLKRSTLRGVSNSGYQFTVDLTVPLFNRGQAATSLATAHRARAEAEAAAGRIRIESEVRAAHAVLAIQQQRARQYRDAVVSTAEPLVRVGRVGYEEGELGILELLDSERQAVEARIRALELAAAARRAAIELDRVIGRELRP
jgi:cobalt-zinc-cadmium efflux system outer membrane protein